MPSAVPVTLSGPAGSTILGGAFAPGGGGVLGGSLVAGDAVGSGGLVSAAPPPPPPPAPTGNIVQYLTSDGGTAVDSGNFSGPTRDLWHKRMGHYWKRRPTTGPLVGLGNWLDAAQVEDGPTAYASTGAATTVGQTLSATVTTLVQRWLTSGANRGFYLSTRGSAFPLGIYGRGDATDANRPKLTVVTDISTYVLTAAANASWNKTSYTGSGTKNLWQVVAGSQPAVLRFDLTGVRGTVSSATLSFVVAAFDTGHTGHIIDVFELDPPTLIAPESVNTANLGLRNTYASFGAWKASGNGALIAADDFELGGAFDGGFTPAATRSVNSVTGTTYARGEITAGQLGSASSRLEISSGTGARGVPNVVVPEAFGQYHLYLESDFGTTADTAIKIPAMGVQFGYWVSTGAGTGYWQQTTGNGGNRGTGLKVDRGGSLNFEYQGHSVRFLTGVCPTAEDDDPYNGWFGIGIYDYHLDQVGAYPDGAPFPNICIRRDLWYCFDIRVKQNTMSGSQDSLGNYATANPDGIYQVWINGTLAYSRTNYRWRFHPEFGVQGVWIDVYHGGVLPAPTTMHYRLDRVSIATSFIGPAKRDYWPAWRRAMAANTWAEVPSTNVLSALDPDVLGLMPSGNNVIGTRGMTLGYIAWTGAVWEESKLTFRLPNGGGHLDYGGNEPYRIGLGVDAPTFSRDRLPSGAIGMPAVNAYDATRFTGRYSDGRRRPGHPYNNQTFVPGLGPMVTRTAGAYPDGVNANAGVHLAHVRQAYWLDEAGESHDFCDFNSVDPGNPAIANDDGGAAFDPTRGAKGTLWTCGHGTSRLIKIDIATRVATLYAPADNYMPDGGKLLYLPGLDVLAFVGSGSNFQIMRIDLGATTPVSPTVTGSYSAGLITAIPFGVGADWDAENGQIGLWCNETNRAEVSTLTPSNPANPSAGWVRGVRAVSGSNTVTPPLCVTASADGASPFGRWARSSGLGGYALLPGVSQKPYFFATE